MLYADGKPFVPQQVAVVSAVPSVGTLVLKAVGKTSGEPAVADRAPATFYPAPFVEVALVVAGILAVLLQVAVVNARPAVGAFPFHTVGVTSVAPFAASDYTFATAYPEPFLEAFALEDIGKTYVRRR